MAIRKCMGLRNSESPAWVALLWHTAVAGSYIFMRLRFSEILEELKSEGKTLPGYDRFGGRYKYLTQINLLLQVIFFTSAAFVDVLRIVGLSQKELRPVQRILDVVFTTLVFPMAMFIVAIFWPLFLYNRELIFPAILDQYLPSYINHFEHGAIAMFVLIEVLLVRHESSCFSLASAIILSVGTSYMCIVFYVAYMSDYWVYGILIMLKPFQRVLFFAAMFGLVFAVFTFGKLLNFTVWGQLATSVQSSPPLQRKKIR